MQQRDGIGQDRGRLRTDLANGLTGASRSGPQRPALEDSPTPRAPYISTNPPPLKSAPPPVGRPRGRQRTARGGRAAWTESCRATPTRDLRCAARRCLTQLTPRPVPLGLRDTLPSRAHVFNVAPHAPTYGRTQSGDVVEHDLEDGAASTDPHVVVNGPADGGVRGADATDTASVAADIGAHSSHCVRSAQPRPPPPPAAAAANLRPANLRPATHAPPVDRHHRAPVHRHEPFVGGEDAGLQDGHAVQ